MSSPIPEPYSIIVAPYSPEHPRNGEADIIRLASGDLLLAYGRWNGAGGDFDFAEVWSKTSSDGGRTWGDDRVLVPNEGKVTTFSVSLLRLANGEILLSYLTKDSRDDCTIWFRTSSDECRTWSSRVKFEPAPGESRYTGMNNNRLIQLKSGRILAAAWDGDHWKDPLIGFTLYSDDDGLTWTKSSVVDIRVLDPINVAGAQEPAVVELKDGRVMMIIRNNLGCIARSYSADQGETWSPPMLVRELSAPLGPASIARLPQTGDLLLIWNNNPKERQPLNSAISKDEGETWGHIRVVDEGNITGWGFAYTSITPVDDNVLLTYWYGDASNLKLTALDYRWFYK